MGAGSALSEGIRGTVSWR